MGRDVNVTGKTGEGGGGWESLSVQLVSVLVSLPGPSLYISGEGGIYLGRGSYVFGRRWEGREHVNWTSDFSLYPHLWLLQDSARPSPTHTPLEKRSVRLDM